MREFDFYIVGTPIGNLGDISPRALEVLDSVDFIAAEDTRNTVKLLTHFNIKKPLVSYFEHNKRERGQEIIKLLESGKRGALVSDAGMPAISDPGADLVLQLYEAGFTVTAVPGPTAFSTALVLSGLDTSRFTFEGFLSTTRKNRMQRLESLKSCDSTVIFYEGPTKLINTLRDIRDVFGDRRCAVVRELTKLYEQVLRGSITEQLEYFEANPPRGEFCIVVEGITDAPQEEKFWSKLSPADHVEYYIKTGCDKKAAIKLAAADRNVPKSEIYNAVMKK